MEDWQREHITQNLPQLLLLTEYNVIVKAELAAKKILSKADVDKLDALQILHGQSDTSYQYYQLLMARTNAYKVLAKALHENQQTGAARILIDGVPKKVSDKPFTYLGISIKLNRFKDMEIEVTGKKLMIKEFFPTANHENLQQIFEETINELEIYDTFIVKERTFVLANNTVPAKPPIYISRFLSNRIKIDERIFKAECPDVFVFKNTFARHKLSDLASPNSTDLSISQLTKITSRFIYLEETEDWIVLKKIAHVPIHLINHETNGNIFLLEDSSAPSDILERLGSRKKSVYISEDEFIQQHLNDNSNSVCICDTPGMGKTFLLANIARLMTEKFDRRINVYIILTALCRDFGPPYSNNSSEPEKALLNVLKFASPSKKHAALLLKLAKAKQILIEVFFDGFDEISADKVEWTKQVFQSITTNFPKVRIYIASRPHMRRELENSLGVVAYDILPFTQQNQIDFLVQFWWNQELGSDQCTLESHATNCLKAVNQSLTKDDKEIAGIPLLCQLIGEIYSDEATFHTVKRRNFSDVPLRIFGMYHRFTQMKVNFIAKDNKEFDDIKLAHVWHALKLLFPMNNFHEDKKFENVRHLLTSPRLLNIGILQKSSNSTLEFIHRTFAEYLVADYFFTELECKEMQKTEEITINSMPMLRLLLKCQKVRWNYHFLNPVIVSFVNSALDEANVSEQFKFRAVVFLSFISQSELISLLCTCCQHNCVAIFSVLRESLHNCNNSRILECFTDANNYELLKVCITCSTSRMLHSCVQLFTEVLKLDAKQINAFKKSPTMLQIAVEYSNYGAVEYFVNRVSLRNQRIIETCVQYRYDIDKREHILLLMLNKDPILVQETPDILVKYNLDIKLFKILAKFGTKETCRKNYVMHARTFMSPSDFHELVRFLLTDCNAEYLFLVNQKWNDPLPELIRWVPLLPKTLELLLNIPGIDIDLKDEDRENLLFFVVKRNKLNALQQLVSLGLDFSARGKWNRSLLHVAAKYRGVDMVRYILSLRLDPNSRDQYESTPLHYAAESLYNSLPIVVVLVENGANVQAKNDEGQTALHLAAAKEYDPSNEIIKYLIRKGAGVNDCDNDGNTPLHLCRWDRVWDCLVEMGADIHAKNKTGEAPAQRSPWLLSSSN